MISEGKSCAIITFIAQLSVGVNDRRTVRRKSEHKGPLSSSGPSEYVSREQRHRATRVLVQGRKVRQRLFTTIKESAHQQT